MILRYREILARDNMFEHQNFVYVLTHDIFEVSGFFQTLMLL